MTARYLVVYVAFLCFMMLLGASGGVFIGDQIIAHTLTSAAS